MWSVRARMGNEAGRCGAKGMNCNTPEAASDGQEQNAVLRGQHGKNGSGENIYVEGALLQNQANCET